MTRAVQPLLRLESLLAQLLRYGSWLASIAIGLGFALALIDARYTRIETLGIALFILLPVMRVLLMLIDFTRQRDYRFAGIAMLVLTIILVAFAVGIRDAPGNS